jgi:hypothetical protein
MSKKTFCDFCGVQIKANGFFLLLGNKNHAATEDLKDCCADCKLKVEEALKTKF